MLIFITYLANIIVCTTQTLSHIKSQQIIGHMKQHFMTASPLTYVINGIQDFVKCCIKVQCIPTFDPKNMLFCGLQPISYSMYLVIRSFTEGRTVLFNDVIKQIIMINDHSEESRCCHYMGYSFRLAARVILYVQCYRKDSAYHGLCYTSRGALTGTRNSSMGPPWRIDHERPFYHGVPV